MKKKLLRLFAVLFMFCSSFYTAGSAAAVPKSPRTLDAVQFVDDVAVENSNGTPITDNKIPDTSSIRLTYSLDIGDGSNINLSQPYTLPLPTVLSYTSSAPIQLMLTDGTVIGTVSISSGLVTIQFDPAISSLTNVKADFFFSSEFDQNQIDYTSGNDLVFPTKADPNHAVHINFSKTGSGGGSSGESQISKMVSSYDSADPTIVNWTVVVNRRGEAIADSNYQDVMENAQYYIPSSLTYTLRNWNLDALSSETADPVITEEADGTQTFTMNFGALTSETDKNDNAVTSVLIHYQTKLAYNANNPRYPNTASAYDGSQLLDSVTTSATYRGQGGNAGGDQMTDLAFAKSWQDDNNAFNSRPASIKVALLQNGRAIKRMVVTPDKNGNWRFTFTNVPVYDGTGTDYKYELNELNVPSGYSASMKSASVLLNTYHANKLISLSGTKTWKDNDNAAGLRPASVTVHLLANRAEKASKVVSSSDNWQYSFANLPEKDTNGQPINYTVSEDLVPGYTTEVNGMNLVNTLISRPTTEPEPKPGPGSEPEPEPEPEPETGPKPKPGPTSPKPTPSSHHSIFSLIAGSSSPYSTITPEPVKPNLSNKLPRTNDPENSLLSGIGITILALAATGLAYKNRKNRHSK